MRSLSVNGLLFAAIVAAAIAVAPAADAAPAANVAPAANAAPIASAARVADAAPADTAALIANVVSPQAVLPPAWRSEAAAEPQPVAVAAVQVSTTARIPPVLPGTVEVNYSDGSYRAVAVDWADVAATDYAEPGRFVVPGVVSGVPFPAHATVVVTQAEQPRTPALNLSGGTFPVGGAITIRGMHFAIPTDGEGRGGSVVLSLHPAAAQLGTAAVSADRSFSENFVIPVGIAAGEYRVRALQDGVETLSATFTVTATPEPESPSVPSDPGEGEPGQPAPPSQPGPAPAPAPGVNASSAGGAGGTNESVPNGGDAGDDELAASGSEGGWAAAAGALLMAAGASVWRRRGSGQVQ